MQYVTTLHPRQEPTIMVSLNGMKIAPFMIDPSAIFSCVGQEVSRLRLSQKHDSVLAGIH